MKKDIFQNEYEKIEVPKEEVLQAIKKGRKRADIEREEGKGKRRRKGVCLSVATAAGIFLVSSFTAPTFSNAMAEVPLVGSLYESFNDLVGRSLESEQLITALHETASSRGVDVTVTSAYYDGAVIGVTFDVKGKMKTEPNGEVQGFYEIFNGSKKLEETKETVYMEPSDQGFTGHIQLPYPELELPDNTTFPLEFLAIGGKEGNWKFNVPIEQLPYETIKVGKESSRADTDVKVRFDSVMSGQASTTIDYTAVYPEAGKRDQTRLEVYNDKGNKIQSIMGGIGLQEQVEDGKRIVKERSVILQPLKEQTSYIEIQPKVAIHEPDRFISLDEITPVQLASDRQDLSITVEKMEVNKESVWIDLQINQGEEKGKGFYFFEDVARTDVILTKESEKEIYQKPMEHTIKVLDKENLRFRSIFNISEISNFNPDNFVVRVSLGGLSSNIPIELEKVKIQLD